MSTFKITIFGFFLLIALASVSGSKCPQENASKLVVCYYKSEISLSNFNICSCTHVVFVNGMKKGDNNSFSLNEGVKRNLDLIKKKKENILALFTLEVKSNEASAILKSENRSDELVTGVVNLLQESGFNGVELNFKFTSEDGVSKDSYVSFVKKLSKTLSSAHIRVKREGYDVFEKVQDDVTTAAYTTQTPKNSTSRTQSINRREKKKSRNTREDRDNVGQTEKVSLEEAINKEFSSEKPSEKDEENKREENKFLVFLRLSIEPEIIGKKFDLKLLGRYADVLVVPTHDIVSKKEDHLTYHPSRLMGISDMLNTDSVLDFLTGIGAPKSKIVVMMPMTVLKFQLKDVMKNTPRSPSSTKPQALDQSQFCSLLSKSRNWTIERDDDLTAPYAYSGKTWLAFEDKTSIGIKGKYILLRELAGGAVYPIDADINDGSCPNRTRSGFLVETLHRNFENLGRKPRALVLENLQEEIHSAGFSGIEAGVKQSEYRIVRIVDHSGAVHVIRRNTKTQFECSRQGYFSHPLGCNKFYRCVKFDQYSDEFTVFEYDCPAGLAFDERWEVCVWPGSLPNGAPCTGSSEIAPVPRSHYRCPNQEGYYADLENCRWFFACLDHARDGVTPLTAYEFRCPFGLVFNEERLACDWPWLVGACGNKGAAGFLKVQTEFINGGNLAASSGQYGSLEQEATFHGFGRGFGSGLGLREGAQSAGFGYIGSGIDDTQNRASFGSFPDFEISGGRISNTGGVILEQNIVGLPDPAGKYGGSLYTENAKSSNINLGGIGPTNKQSGFLYHRNSQSSYGQGSVSVLAPTVSIPLQNEYTGHSTVAANNLLLEYGQKEKYRGDASFQDAVATPKPFLVNIPKVEINQFEASTGHTTAGNALLAAGFGQKEDIREITSKTKAHVFHNSVASGGSVTPPTVFSTTPTPSASNGFGVSGVSNSNSYSFANENVGGVSSITPKPSVHISQYSSSRGLQEGFGSKGVSFQQFADIQPTVSISTPLSFSSKSTSSSFKTLDQDFKYSSGYTSGFSSSAGVTKQGISNIATLKPEVHVGTFGQDSSDAVKIQDLGHGGVHFSTPQPNINSITSSASQPVVPVNVAYPPESKINVGISGSIIPKAEVLTFGDKSAGGEQGVQGFTFKQAGASLSTPKSFSTTPGVQVTKPIEVSLGQPELIAGHSFEPSAGDPNFGGSVSSIPGVPTFGYASSQGKETVVNGHGVFGQKFNVQTKVPVSTVRPQPSVNVAFNPPVTPRVEEYSSGVAVNGPSSSRPSLYTLQPISSGQVSDQSLNKEFSKSTVSYSNSNPSLRPISQTEINQPGLAVSGGYLFEHTGQVDTLNVPQSGVQTLEFTSTQGKRIGQDTSFGQLADIHQGVSVAGPPSFSTTLRPPDLKITNQAAASLGSGYAFDKVATEYSGRSNGPVPVISSTLKPIAGFEQTSPHSALGQQDGKGGFVPSFVSTLQPPIFKPADVSVSHTVSGYSAQHTGASTTSKPYSFEFTSGRNQQKSVGEQNIQFGQSLPAQPVTASTPVTFGTSLKTQNFNSLGVSVSQPVLGISVPHFASESGVRAFESSQSVDAQDKKISQPFTPVGGVSPYEFGSTPKYAFEETSLSKERQNVKSVSIQPFVPPGKQVFKSTGASYSYEQSRIPQNLFQQNIDVKVSNEINSNKDVTYGVPAKVPDSGFLDNRFNAKTGTGFIPTVNKPADGSAHILTGQHISYDTFNPGGSVSTKTVSSTPRQQEILAEFSIEKQPIESVGVIDSFKFDRVSTPGPDILSQAVGHANVPLKTVNNYQQQTFTQNVKPFTSTVTLQQELVPVTESKSYLPPVTPKTDIFRPAAKIVPFKSVGVEQGEENFEFLKTHVNGFKPREELTGLEISKSIELNPKGFYLSTPRPVVVQQQPVNLLSQRTYSVGVIQSSGKDEVQPGYKAPISSTSLPVSYSTVRTTIDDERVASSGNGVTPGLFEPNTEISTSSRTAYQHGRHIAQQPQYTPLQTDNAYFQPHSGFDFQKIKVAQSQPDFSSLNITRFSLNPNIEIPEPPREYLAQFSTQSSEPAAKGKFKSTSYVPPENDNQQARNKNRGSGQAARGRGSSYGYDTSGARQEQRSRGRQYHGGITSNQRVGDRYEKYEVNGQRQSDAKTTIDLTNLKVDKDKKTVIVVSQVSDANPILIGKLAGQCSCQSNVVELKNKGKKSLNKKNPQIINQFLPPLETSLQNDASTPESVVLDDKSATTPQPVSSTILSSLSPDGVLTITPKSVYAGSLKKKQFRGRARYLPPAEDLLSAVPASEIASTVDYAGDRNEIDGRGAGAAFDRYGPGGWRGFDETLQGSVDCKRPGLFRHPKYCNKFYSCNYDPWKERYVLHVFNCPIHLAYDSSISACNWPVRGPACADDNLLV